MPSQVSHTGTRGSLGLLSRPCVRPAVLKRHLRDLRLHCSNPLGASTRATGLQTSQIASGHQSLIVTTIPSHAGHNCRPRGRKRPPPPFAWAPWEAHLSIFIHRDLSWVQTPFYTQMILALENRGFHSTRCKQVSGSASPQGPSASGCRISFP